ncbi:MAG: alpha/beta fold hydrolase [Acidimicrobiales bacterium]
MDEFVRAQEDALRRYGVDAETRFVDVDAVGGRAHVVVAGDGPPVIMVIGGGLPAAMWAPLMAKLQGYRLHAVDLPGLGLTDPVRYSTVTLRSCAVEFLDQVRAGLGIDRAVLVGHSVGGVWSTWTALDRPDGVAAVVLVACPAAMLGTSAPLPLRLWSVPGLGALMNRLQPPSPKQADMLARAAGEDFTDHPELRSLLVAGERLPGWADQLADLVGSVVRLSGSRRAVQLGDGDLQRLTRPVQLIWGRDDTFGPPSVGERAAQLIPRAELHVVPGGHGPWFRYSGQVAERVAPFLRTHGART